MQHTLFYVNEAVSKLEEGFMSAAHMDINTTVWHTLKFSAVKVKCSDKPLPQVLELRFGRANDLQSMLDEGYYLSILLSDCIVRALKHDELYVSLITAVASTDPDILQQNDSINVFVDLTRTRTPSPLLLLRYTPWKK